MDQRHRLKKKDPKLVWMQLFQKTDDQSLHDLFQTAEYDQTTSGMHLKFIPQGVLSFRTYIELYL